MGFSLMPENVNLLGEPRDIVVVLILENAGGITIKAVATAVILLVEVLGAK